MKYIWLILLLYCIDGCVSWLDEEMRGNLRRMMIDVIKDTNTRIGHLSEIQQTCHRRPAYEVGYLMYTLQDKYRRMVDKYHAAKFLRRRLFIGEFVQMLIEVEIHFWEIEHILNMMHEIERKYKVKDWIKDEEEGGREDYVLFTSTTPITTIHTRPIIKWRTRSRTKRKQFNQFSYMWSKIGVIPILSLSDIKNKILSEMSWPIKLKLLKDYKGKPKESVHRRVGIQAYRMQVLRTEDVEITTEASQDESNMKMKLFRLMYETIRDSDIKIKRAEVLKQYYSNTTSFNLGFMMGEITEKFNVMRDIASTMKRLYGEWKPMEHINAYEQIANKAVELATMVDVAKSLLKHDTSHTDDNHKL